MKKYLTVTVLTLLIASLVCAGAFAESEKTWPVHRRSHVFLQNSSILAICNPQLTNFQPQLVARNRKKAYDSCRRRGKNPSYTEKDGGAYT